MTCVQEHIHHLVDPGLGVRSRDRVVRPLGRGRKGILHLSIHRSSALRATTCAYLARTSAEVLTHRHPAKTIRRELSNALALHHRCRANAFRWSYRVVYFGVSIDNDLLEKVRL